MVDRGGIFLVLMLVGIVMMVAALALVSEPNVRFSGLSGTGRVFAPAGFTQSAWQTRGRQVSEKMSDRDGTGLRPAR